MTAGDPASYRALRSARATHTLDVIDQRALPHAVRMVTIADADTAARAIRDMWIRGAPLIGAVAAFGLSLALQRDPSDVGLDAACRMLLATRPTAVNLRWALERVRGVVQALPPDERADAAWSQAERIVAEDIAINEAIGHAGLAVLRGIAAERGRVNVMTHCNAGALATCGWGTATAPLYLAHAERLPLHVLVSETRPRLQGANLTAWEMAQRRIPYTLLVDSASGLLMQRGEVDLVIVGADRVARNGDVCNKIGTYDKALAAHDNGVPFYVGLPSPTIDWTLASGRDIPIEARGDDEVLTVAGRDERDEAHVVAVAPAGARAINYAFDVTPARLVTGLVTERGIAGTAAALAQLFHRTSPCT